MNRKNQVRICDHLLLYSKDGQSALDLAKVRNHIGCVRIIEQVVTFSFVLFLLLLS